MDTNIQKSFETQNKMTSELEGQNNTTSQMLTDLSTEPLTKPLTEEIQSQSTEMTLIPIPKPETGENFEEKGEKSVHQTAQSTVSTTSVQTTPNSQSQIAGILNPKSYGHQSQDLQHNHGSGRSTVQMSHAERVALQKKINTRGLSGLSNFGATCYMNAAIQSLNATPSFLAYMIHPDSDILDHLQKRILDDIFLKHEKEDAEKGVETELTVSTSDLQEKAKEKLPYKLRLMMKRMWAHNCEVQPKQLKRYVDKNLKYFLGGFQQHDSQEFLTALLDNIHESTKAEGIVTVQFDAQTADLEAELKVLESALSTARKQKDVESVKMLTDQIDNLYTTNPASFLKIYSVWAWHDILKSAYSVINDIFSGMSVSTITCSDCKKSTHKFERNDLLSLHLPESIEENRDKYTLIELMKNYTASEIMTNTNKCHCRYCGIKTDAIKKNIIYQQPNVLVIMFKKYQQYRGSIVKSNVKIDYPHILDIKEFVSEHTQGNTQYELYSVIRHSGGTNGGHYYTYFKNMINGLWYLADDGDVYNVDPDEPLRCNGYVLFYKQTENEISRAENV